MTQLEKRFPVALDVKRSVSNREIEVVEGDNGNIIDVTLTDNGQAVDLTGCRVVAVFSKSNGTSAQDSDAIDGGVSIDGNKICIALFIPSFAPGMVECELQVYSGAEKTTLVTSAKFNFKCRRAILNDDTVRVTKEYPMLVSLIGQCGALLESFDGFSQAEQARSAAEATRDMEETDRAASETARNTAEQMRQALYGDMLDDYSSGAFDAQISLGAVHTGNAGTDAEITNTGTPGHAVLNFKLPRGDKGETGDVSAHAAQHAFGGSDPVKIGSSANLPVFTGAGGTLAVKAAEDARTALDVYDKGTVNGISSAVQGIDERLTNEVEPAVTELNKAKNVFTTAGAAPSFTVADTSVAAYTAGLRRTVQFHAAGTAATLNFNGKGAKALYEYTGKAMNVNAGQVAEVYYNGTSFFGVSAGGSGIGFPSAPYAGNTVLLALLDADSLTATTTYQTPPNKRFTVGNTGTYRIRYDVRNNGAVAGSVRLLKEGAVVSDSELTGLARKTIDVAAFYADVFELQVKVASGSTANSINGYCTVSIYAPEVQPYISSIVSPI